MSEAGPDLLTRAQKRALLAERLRDQSGLGMSAKSSPAVDDLPRPQKDDGRRSFLDGEVIPLSSLKTWRLEE